MELSNDTLRLIHTVLRNAEGLCMNEYIECSNELLRLDLIEAKPKKNSGDCSMETIARALNKLEKEIGFGVKNDEDKQQESEGEKTTELCERYIEGTLPAIT